MDAYIYSYVVGGAIFSIGLFYGYKNGYIGLSGRKLRNLLLALSTISFFALLQGYLQYAPMEVTPPQAYTGGADEVLSQGRIRGTALDYGIVAVYFVLILVIGIWFGRKQKTTKDFFFGGQRFAWWLIAFSLIATTVGSYSFVKYSEIGYKYGMGVTQSYWNDWIWFPLLVFGWLPILYFSRIVSIPEYFGRRFGPKVRLSATIYMLIYLIGYVGVNLYTMGTVLNKLVGWEVFFSAAVVAVISVTYVTAGGQTSVIMTDLFQGLVLLIVGVLIFVLGAAYIGGFDLLWTNLPREGRMAFPNFNEQADFPAIGVFWQDGVANSAMFLFLHQGIMMRFMAAKSANEGRKAALAMTIGLMFIGSLVVASGGLVARALSGSGALPEMAASDAFYIATELLSHPGVFGLILAALTAALMSTVDTLITAVAAVVVNDLYQPYIRPKATERQLLSAARIAAISVTVLGVLMVPIFTQFTTIYAAHSAFTGAVTPPLVVALLLSVFWRRFTRKAALSVLIGGFACILFSLFWPEVIAPFAHGVPMGEPGEGFLGGMRQQPFMRACYGIVICLVIGVVVTLRTQPESKERQKGLVWGTIGDALRFYKGSPGKESKVTKAMALPQVLEVPLVGTSEMTGVRLSSRTARDLQSQVGNLVYVTDSRWWTGGLYSAHAIVAEIVDQGDERSVAMETDVHGLVVFRSRRNTQVRVERLYETISEEEAEAIEGISTVST